MRFACGFASRMRGLLFRGGFDEEMLICPCCSVHTFGMRQRIDVAFVDTRGVVLSVFRDVGPSRVLKRRTSSAVVERVSQPGAPWYEPGDRVGLAVLGRKRSERSCS